MTDQQNVGWKVDVLGAPFEQKTLPLGKDDEGDVVATLVRLLPPEQSFVDRLRGKKLQLADVDILYVHGWSDYFFQSRLAKFWVARGARFFALDLRKYGRSLREGQSAGYITDLATYDDDISAALEAMGWDPKKPRTDRRLVLFGHSTGGLTVSLWADAHPGYASAVLLNSPWLALQLPATARHAVAGLLQLQANWAPMEVGPQLDGGFYSRAQHEVADPDDPVDINLDWRPEKTNPVRGGWLNAVATGQHKVHTGLSIDCPVTVLLSARSEMPLQWNDKMTSADTVLIVDDIADEALHLGKTVTIERIDGALHDVFLSAKAPRDEAYARLARFADILALR